jgi:hypothetical protein
MHSVLIPHGKKNLKPHDVLKFPWEKTKRTTGQDVKKMIDRFQQLNNT